MPPRPRVTPPDGSECEDSSITGYRGGCKCPGCRRAVATKMRNFFRSVGGNPYRDPARTSARLKERRAAGEKLYRDSARDAYDRRRARKKGATVEAFKRVDVFERDGWACGICSEPVDRELIYPDPRSASLDHVVPLSLGGEHSRANARLAHLDCNVRRGNRVA